MTPAQFANAERYMLATMQGSTHDVLHVRRVLGYALLLCEGTACNRDVVILAALLHDVGRPDEDADATLCHAAVGAEKARAFLQGEGYGGEVVSAVANCVARHRFRKGGAPDTLEAQILYDADKLDVSGATGIARTLQYGGELGEPLYQTDEAGQPLPGSSGEPDSFLRECNTKLRHLPERLFTQRARAIATRRLDIVNQYANALQAELAEAHEAIHRAALTALPKEDAT